MEDLHSALRKAPDATTKLQAMATFESKVQRGRGFQGRYFTTFKDMDTVTEENVKEDANKSMEGAVKQFDFGSPGTPGATEASIPRSPLTKGPRQGQQPLVQQGTDILRETLGITEIPDPPNANRLNVYFAIYAEGGTKVNPPRIAVRKRKDETIQTPRGSMHTTTGLMSSYIKRWTSTRTVLWIPMIRTDTYGGTIYLKLLLLPSKLPSFWMWV